MSLRTIVFARCTTHAGLSALIGSRCYPDRLPEGVVYPAVSYRVISGDNSPYRTQDNVNNPTTRAVSRVQFDSYDNEMDNADAVAEQIRQAWDGYQDDCTVGYAFQANRFTTRADSINEYRVITDVMIEYGEG